MKVLTALAFCVVFAVTASAAGQRGGGGAPAPNQPAAPAAPPAGTNQPTNQPQPTQPNQTQQNQNQTPTNVMPIFITGAVMLSDGTKPPPNVLVRLICGTGSYRAEAYADVSGNFSIVLGGGSAFTDAFATIDVERGLSRGNQSGQNGINSLFGCEVKASLGGYDSTSVPLNRQSSLDDPNVGTIYLHRLGDGGVAQDVMVSLTTKLAPKDARKEYEKGLESVKKEKWAEAEQSFSKAVGLYSKYAIAWFELGKVYQQEKRLDDAFEAHKKAIEMEPKFVSPYGELTTLAFRKQDWTGVVGYTSQIIKMAPFTPPEVFFYNAAANYNLHQLEAADKSIRVAARLDTKHKVPRINFLFALILEQKEDWAGAVENLKLYLQYNPAANDKADVEAELEKIQKRAGN